LARGISESENFDFWKICANRIVARSSEKRFINFFSSFVIFVSLVVSHPFRFFPAALR
jgi:hypothetical protein